MLRKITKKIDTGDKNGDFVDLFSENSYHHLPGLFLQF
jgi:hypothetical protein